jgi:hypothetical protein
MKADVCTASPGLDAAPSSPAAALPLRRPAPQNTAALSLAVAWCVPPSIESWCVWSRKTLEVLELVDATELVQAGRGAEAGADGGDRAV